MRRATHDRALRLLEQQRASMRLVRRAGTLAARAVVPLGSPLPAVLLDQFHGPRNVSASVL